MEHHPILRMGRSWSTCPWEEQTTPTLQVPLLVTPESLEHPILGYNLIETMTQGQTKDKATANLSRLLPHTKKAAVNQLVTLLECSEDEEICQVYTCRADVTIAAGETRLVKCRRPNRMVDSTTVLFEPKYPRSLPDGLTASCSPVDIRGGRALTFTVPVSNDTKRDLVLPGRTQLGRLTPLRTILPATFFKNHKSEYPH